MSCEFHVVEDEQVAVRVPVDVAVGHISSVSQVAHSRVCVPPALLMSATSTIGLPEAGAQDTMLLPTIQNPTSRPLATEGVMDGAVCAVPPVLATNPAEPLTGVVALYPVTRTPMTHQAALDPSPQSHGPASPAASTFR